MIPCLMITYNRLEYTKKALPALLDSDVDQVMVIDNGSTDGTVKWLLESAMQYHKKLLTWFNTENHGIAGAMNQFIEYYSSIENPVFLTKVDNDTIVPKHWAYAMADRCWYYGFDMMQAKHHIIEATCPGGWNAYVKKMKKIAPGTYESKYIGGSGIIFRRSAITKIPETDWKLFGWRKFQQENPKLKKGFCDNVEIELLDAHGYTDYPDYYKETKRI